ncbi:MAG: hypothetical protein KJO82_06555, partial [Gammaproteobacteria bacterium]|nr:hypothetical protein [Gammaproteobacteria bacterium]
MRPERLLLLLFAAGLSLADDIEIGGHGKFRLLTQSYPDNSVFRSFAGANSVDPEADLRLNFAASRGRWQFEAAYQLLAVAGDRIEWSRNFGDTGAPLLERLPNDDRRLMSLTDVIHDQGRSAQVQRLDRLSLRYSSDKIVARIGRQALSWGNGLFYSPMDLVNPF